LTGAQMRRGQCERQLRAIRPPGSWAAAKNTGTSGCPLGGHQGVDGRFTLIARAAGQHGIDAIDGSAAVRKTARGDRGEQHRHRRRQGRL
jgi:hypothetical protein